jgi:hypothetical protein
MQDLATIDMKGQLEMGIRLFKASHPALDSDAQVYFIFDPLYQSTAQIFLAIYSPVWKLPETP